MRKKCKISPLEARKCRNPDFRSRPIFNCCYRDQGAPSDKTNIIVGYNESQGNKGSLDLKEKERKGETQTNAYRLGELAIVYELFIDRLKRVALSLSESLE